MRYDNGDRVRIKIPGHRTYGTVVETVAPFEHPTAKPDRFYTQGGSKPVWSPTGTDTICAAETLLVRVEIDGGRTPPLYRVLPSMLEPAE